MIEIACSADEPYLPHVSAMLHSLLTHTVQRPLRIWLLHGTELSVAGRARVAEVALQFGASIEFLPVSQDMAVGFSAEKFHPSCWYRILLPALMPQLDRILYLDADMIVADDLSPLWETELRGKLFAAVPNPLYPFMRSWPSLDMGLSDPLDYLNSGMLLMDLAQMRTEGFIEKLREYSIANPDRLLPEQDALSDLMRGRWLRLHPRWNMQTAFYEVAPAKLPFPKTILREAMKSPAIIHFCGWFKPWHYSSVHPHRDLYFQHLRGTSWPTAPLEYNTLIYRVLRPLPPIIQYNILTQRSAWRAFYSKYLFWLGRK